MFFFKTRYYTTENQIIKYNSNQAAGPHTHYTLIYRKLHLTHYFKQAFSHHPAKLSPMILASHFLLTIHSIRTKTSLQSLIFLLSPLKNLLSTSIFFESARSSINTPIYKWHQLDTKYLQ